LRIGSRPWSAVICIGSASGRGSQHGWPAGHPWPAPQGQSLWRSTGNTRRGGSGESERLDEQHASWKPTEGRRSPPPMRPLRASGTIESMPSRNLLPSFRKPNSAGRRPYGRNPCLFLHIAAPEHASASRPASAHSQRYASVFAPHRRPGSEGRMRLVDPQRWKGQDSDPSRCFARSRWELPGGPEDCQQPILAR